MIYDISRLITRVLGALFWRLRVAGIENLPLEGGVVLAVNHQSFLDVGLLGAVIPRRVTYLARRTLWDNRLLGAWMTRVGALPVSRGAPAKDEIKAVIGRAREGAVVALFPEGTRTRDGSIGEFRGGIAMIARRARSPVVPVLIQGSFEAWPRTHRWPRPGRVVITIGRPKTYGREWEDDEAAADIRERLLALRNGSDRPQSAGTGDEADGSLQRGGDAA